MNVFELFGTIAIKNRDANAALQDTTQRAERAGNRIQESFKKIGEMSVKIAKPVIAGATAIGTAIATTAEKTRDYRTAMAKLETAFLTNGHSAETAMETYRALQAVLGETDQSVEAANHLAVMCDNQEDLSKWTEICTGVFATFGDSLPIEGLTESANETSKVGQVTGSLADALNWAGISEDDFNKKLKACRTEQERQDLIMNTLYWTYKAASDQYKETGKSVMEANSAQDKLNASMAKLGEICEPIVSDFKIKIADLVNFSVPYIERMVGSFTNFSEKWNQFALNLALGYDDMKKSQNQLGLNLAKGWDENVLPHIKEKFKVIFGVDMPSWSDIAIRIAEGWNSVMSSISGLFNINIGTSYGGVIGGTIGGSFGGGSSRKGNGAGRSFAAGLDRVPNDGYIARLHKDEAVLNKADATVWRGGGNQRIESMLSQMVNIMRAGQVIQLDSGIMAGQLTPAIDARLGTVARYKGRGN